MSRVPTWLLTALSTLGTALLVLTVVLPTWIEELFRLEPDGGDGSSEAIITLGFLAVSVATGLGALLAWRSRRVDGRATARGMAP